MDESHNHANRFEKKVEKAEEKIEKVEAKIEKVEEKAEAKDFVKRFKEPVVEAESVIAEPVTEE